MSNTVRGAGSREAWVNNAMRDAGSREAWVSNTMRAWGTIHSTFTLVDEGCWLHGDAGE